MTAFPLRLAAEAASAIREEVARAGGREVSFLADVTSDRVIANPRAVARGNHTAVLAVARDAPEGGVMLHNHPSGLLEPSDADLGVAARLFELGLGTAIVTNAADELYVVVEPPEPRRVEPLSLEELSDLLAPHGPLAELPGYEDREGQREMLRLVAGAFNEGGVELVEAGTGTGKSIAYLVPAARWAIQNGERTIISTNTINLQEQLVEKDIAITERVLGAEIPWALVKGRGNYVSIRRARLAAESAPSLFPDDRSDELTNLLSWLERTEDGSLSDLSFIPTAEVWDEVKSDTDACLRAKCPFFQQCHYQKARRAAAAADLVIVNHSLFFSDLSVRIASGNVRDGAVLPAYDRVIFDEAHHLEDSATPHLGAEVTRAGILRTLARLDRGGRGVLKTIDATLAENGSGSGAGLLRERMDGRVRPKIEGLRSAVTLFFDALEPWAEERSGYEGLRLGPATGLEPAEDAAIGERLQNVLIRSSEVEREVAMLRDRLEAEDELRPGLEGHLLDLRSLERGLQARSHALRLCLMPESHDQTVVRWLELRRGKRGTVNVAVGAAPVDLGPLLREHLFGHTRTAVLTSATMATRGNFDYLRDRLGLADPRSAEGEDPGTGDDAPPVTESIVASPFDYAVQSCLVVPTDLPDPRGPDGGAAFQKASADVIYQVAEASSGGVFALFTSFAALRAVAGHLRAAGAGGRWPLYVQGEADRSTLLRAFTEAGSGILIGTSSFWEGVDVPGQPLRALVIQKLPFRVPTEPVTAARLEAMEARGQSSFWQFMVPNAALRLKQGVGRLIRSRSDRGVVVLLDDRLLRKRYGRVLRDSLPPMPLVKGPWHEVRGRVVDFYGVGADIGPVSGVVRAE